MTANMVNMIIGVQLSPETSSISSTVGSGRT